MTKTTESDWILTLQDDIQRRVNMNKKKTLKRKRKRLQPPADISARALYHEAVRPREDQW